MLDHQLVHRILRSQTRIFATPAPDFQGPTTHLVMKEVEFKSQILNAIRQHTNAILRL
eukprot:SAG31_NODE_10824_length_1093_cov_1.196177_1_plen_57_part_10